MLNKYILSTYNVEVIILSSADKTDVTSCSCLALSIVKRNDKMIIIDMFTEGGMHKAEGARQG